MSFFISLLATLAGLPLLAMPSFAQSTDKLTGGRENGLVGSIPCSYRVTSNGQFVYDIPLSLVTGTGGMSPKLSISYNSSNGNGLVGYGFDLAGLSVISRSPRNLFNDGIADIVRFTSQDRFSLDGLRLQFVGTENGKRTYRTESNSYSKIIAEGPVSAPTKFIVHTKDGLVYEYEPTTTSSKSLFWPVVKVSDTKGNYYTVSYNTSSDEYVPVEIKYTGNTTASQEPFASIVFSYQSISRSPSFVGSVRINRRKAINNISIRYDNQEVKSYDFVYSTKKGRLFLSKITENMGGSKLNPTTFEWDNSDIYGLAKKSYTSFPDFHDVYVKTGDFNGDGRRDILTWSNNKNEYKFRVYLNNGNGFDNPICYAHDLSKVDGNSHKSIYGVAVGDFNGDGFDDIAIARQFVGSFYYLDYCEAKVTAAMSMTFEFRKTVKAPVTMQHKMMVTDINNDGAADILMVEANYLGSTYYALMSTSTDNGVVPLVTGRSGSISNDGFVHTSFVDLDGDGTMELLNVWDSKSGEAGSSLYKISKAGELSKVTNFTLGAGDYYIVGDFNGDGKTDFLTTGDKNSTNWEMNLSRGVLIGSYFESSAFTTSYFSQKDKTVYGEDMNGDGLDDLVVIDKKDNKPLEIWINDGSGMGFVKQQCMAVPGSDSRQYLIDAFNGDGKLDLLSYRKRGDSAKGFDVFSTTNTSNDLLTEITDGMDNVTSVDYRHLTDGCVFERGKTHSYPLVSIGNAWPVVYKVTTPSSVYGLHTVTYSYSNAIYHKRGRGMLGFERFAAHDYLTETITEELYDINSKVMVPILKSRNTYLYGDLVHEATYDYTLSFQHNADNRAEWVYSLLPQKIEERQYEYCSLDEVSHVTTTNTYDAYGNNTLCTVNRGGRTVTTRNTYSNDEAGWLIGRLTNSVVAKQDNSGSTSLSSDFKYDGSTGLLVSESYAKGKSFGYTKTYSYDVFGNITKDVKTPNDGSAPRTVCTTYTSDGRFIEKTIDELGFVTTFKVDQILGKKLSETDCNGVTTYFEYDAFGNPSVTRKGIEATHSVKAWSTGNAYAPSHATYYVKTQVSNHTPVWSFYDRLGQLLREVRIGNSPSDVIYVDTQYDKKGQVIAVSEPYFMGAGSIAWNTTEYDDAGRAVEKRNAVGAVVQYSYDGLTTTVTDPMGNTSSTIVDMLGQTVKSVDAMSGTVAYRYDVNGNCTEVKGPRTVITTEYDEAGNRTKLDDPDLGTYTYTYDAYGNMTSETGEDGTATFTYDAAGRPVKEERPDFTYTYEYDTKRKGLLSRKTCSNGNGVEYSYDVYGRETEVRETIHGSMFVTTRKYSSNLLSSVTYPTGLTVGYTYSGNGTISEVHNVSDGKPYWQADKQNARGQTLLATLGNGLAVNTQYNAIGAITDIKSGNLLDTRYEYDLNNNVTSKNDRCIGLSFDYGYDELNRLTSITLSKGSKSTLQTEVQYDEAGNIVYKTGIGHMDYAHGSNRLATVEQGDNNLSVWNDISYTSYNKIQTVLQDHSNPAEISYTTLKLEYGADKARVYQELDKFYRRRVYSPGMPSGNSVLLQKYYIGNLYEKEMTAERTRDLCYIIVGGQPVAVVESQNGKTAEYFMLHDNQGSIVAYTDEHANLVEQESYDPWGRKTDPKTGEYIDMEENPSSITDMGYTGHQHIDLFDMINMDGRMYDPYTGRFLSPDPFVQAPGTTQGLNRYAYCLNNPLSLTDPTGYNWLGNAFSAIVGIAVGVETGGLASGVWGVVASGACAGASAAVAGCMINGANLWQTTKSAIVGGFWGATGAAVNFGIGDITGGNFYYSCTLHSISDGVMEALHGGHLVHGMLTGVASYASGQKMRYYAGYMSYEEQVALSAVLGGAVSVIGGGKFASGAITGAFQMLYNDLKHRGPTYAQLGRIDRVYRESLEDNPSAHDFYRSLGMPEYDNACAARLSYALSKAGVLKIPSNAPGVKRGKDGNYYFMFARDMADWLSQNNVWGVPRIYNIFRSPSIKLQNGVVYQDGFSGVSGHMEYFYNGNDGHEVIDKNSHGAHFYYNEGALTKLWKYGK